MTGQERDVMSMLFGFNPDEIVDKARAEAKEYVDTVLKDYTGDDDWMRGVLLAQAIQSMQIAYLAASQPSPLWPGTRIYEAIREVGVEAVHAMVKGQER